MHGSVEILSKRKQECLSQKGCSRDYLEHPTALLEGRDLTLTANQEAML